MSSAEGEVKYGGIPKADFIEDLPGLLRQRETVPEELLQELQELLGRYKLARTRLEQSKAQLQRKLPEINKALSTLRLLRSKKDEPVRTHFEMADNLYATARIENSDNVLLWLGANVLLEYPAEEAEELLVKNSQAAERQLATLNETIDYVTDQITVTEVNMARVFNYRVKLQRILKASQAASSQ